MYVLNVNTLLVLLVPVY